MSARAQERLEKLREKLRAENSVTAKQENVVSAKTSGVTTRNKDSAVLPHATERPKKTHESLSQINARAPDRKILDLASQKRHEIHPNKAYHQVPEKKARESFTEMRLKKALAQARAPNVSSSDRGSESDKKNLSAALPKTTKSVGGPQQALRNPEFKIPKKPKSMAAEAKSVQAPSARHSFSESLERAANCIHTASKLAPSSIPSDFDKAAIKQNLSGILKSMRSAVGRPESAKTASDPHVGSNKRRNQLTHEQNDQPSQLVKPNQDTMVVAKNGSLERNMFKRKTLGSAPDLNVDGPLTQQTHVDQTPSQSSLGFSEESNQKQQPTKRYDHPSQSIEASYQGSSVVPQTSSFERNMIRKRKVSNSSPDLLPEPQTQSTYSESCRNSSQRESNPEPEPTKQQNDQTVNPSNPKASVVAPISSSVQRNMFKRKPPSDLNLEAPQNRRSHQDLISSQISNGFSKGSNKTQVISQQNSHKPKPEGGLKEIVSRAYKGVVSAVKETAYYCSRSEVSKELQSVRRTVEPVEAMDYEITCATFEDEQTLVQTDLYLVVDTNVAIDNLGLIKSFKTRKVKGMTPKVVVPWQVLKELDYLKEGKNRMDAIISRARKGIHYLVDEMCKYGGFISGQPQKAAMRELEDFKVEVPDDHLIKCCLQLKNNGHNVMLLTNDKNLVIKGVVSGVPSMKCVDFIENCPENEAPQHLSPFESPPAGTFAPDLLPMANAAHLMAVHLKNFLSAVLKKFFKYRFQELWKLRIPGEEPWSLTVLLETIIDYWHEIATKYGAPADVKDTLLFLRRYIHKVAYEKLRYAEVDQFARSCHHLAVALPPSFGVEGICFDNRLAFWKCPPGTDPPADVTFSRSCVNFTIHHMQLFENNLVQYCFCVSKTLGVPFAHSKMSSCYPAVVDLNNLPKILATVEIMGEALTKISSMPLGSAVKPSDGAQAIYSSLVTSLGEAADRRFFVEDVIEFCSCSEIRHLFPDALQSLEVIATFLKSTLEGYRNFQEPNHPNLLF